MIEIQRQADGISVTGHAGYAPIGQDIVCAAVSALLQVFVESVREFTANDIQSDMEAGRAFIRYGNLSERGQLLEDSFFLGCQMIANAYPDHVRVELPRRGRR